MKHNKNVKVVALALILVVCFSSTVFASVNGLFEGFNIVNVVVNNKTIESEIPAINFHGRTMVPIRLIAEELGARVTWDWDKSTAYIDSKAIDSKNYYHKDDIGQLKLYNILAKNYTYLRNTGQLLNEMQYLLKIAHSEITYNNNIDMLLSTQQSYDNLVTIYNNLVENTNYIMVHFKLLELDVSDINKILDDYLTAINHYEVAINILSEYNGPLEHSDYEEFVANIELASEICIKNINYSTDKYLHYVQKIADYK